MGVNTGMDLQLGGNFASKVNPDFRSHVEPLDSRTLKVCFKTKDEEGNPISPGISIWQFGLAFTPILPKHYWEPVVEAAKAAGLWLASVDEAERDKLAYFALVAATARERDEPICNRNTEPFSRFYSALVKYFCPRRPGFWVSASMWEQFS